MASRVFALAEILATIFQNFDNRVGRQSLAICLRVHRRWFAEAARLLWRRCGSIDTVRSTELWPPGIRHLAALESSRNRLQLYAAFIEVLNFNVEGDSCQDVLDNFYGATDDSRDEATFIPLLRKIAFPRLRELRLLGTDFGSVWYEQSTISYWIQHSPLEVIEIAQRDIIPDFFSSIQEHCHLLKQLTVAAPYVNTSREMEDSREKPFIACLKSLTHLTIFEARERFWQGWPTDAVFSALTRLPLLKTLRLANLSDIASLHTAHSPSDLFLSLDWLTLAITEGDFGAMLPLVSRITRLNISVEGASKSILFICSSLSNLTDLGVKYSHPTGSLIKGSDILLLARSCPKLLHLTIAAGSSDESLPDPPGASDVTDDLISELAQLLPKMESLNFHLSKVKLTEQSLLALAYHCPHLRKCGISAVVNPRPLLDARPGIFRELEWLAVEDFSPPVNQQDRKSVVEGIIRIAPYIWSFTFQNPSDENYHLEDEIYGATRDSRP